MLSIREKTSYAILRAMERDLRNVCINGMSDESNPLSPVEEDQAKKRRGGTEKQSVMSALVEWHTLLEYLDLSQLLDVLTRNASAIGNVIGTQKKEIQDLAKRLRHLVPVRNDIAHSRTISIEDYERVLETSRTLRNSTSPINFTELSDEVIGIERDPTYLENLTIPDFWRVNFSTIENNLPIPEFSDTGFVGRQSDRENLFALLHSPNNLITVTGEGGVGKTSLTLKCLEDLVKETQLYDLVHWTSLKTTHLTTAGIRTVFGAMTNESQLLSSISNSFGSGSEAGDKTELFDRVHEILSTIRVLLVIDNLETIDRSSLRPLFINIPNGSKIVITSRIGIGEFEVRYPLEPMKAPDAVALFRRIANLLNARDIAARTDNELATICGKLYFNPLAIRWFVQSYSEGRSVRSLLDGRRNLAEVLEFCFQNLYDTLSDASRKYLRAFVSVGKPLSEVQIGLLSDADDIDVVRRDLAYLSSSNLLKRSRDDWSGDHGSLWAITDFARRFILTHDKHLQADRAKTQQIYRKLIQTRDAARDAAVSNRFDARSIQARSTDEATVVAGLKSAQALSYSNRHSEAIAKIEELGKQLPEFFELWRVSAQVKDRAGDILGAYEDFVQAIELAEGRSQPLYVFYAQCLHRQSEFDKAVEVLTEPASSDDAAPQLIAAYAWAMTLNRQFDEALQAFESIYEEILKLDGDERGYLLTQYADCCQRFSENQLSRHYPDDALSYAVKGLSLVAEACLLSDPDSSLRRVGQKCFGQACKVMSTRCLLSDWEEVYSVAVKVVEFFPIVGDYVNNLTRLQANCPAMTAEPNFLALIPKTLWGAGLDNLTNVRLYGTVIRPSLGTYTFAKGDDGKSYYLHQSDITPNTLWRDLRQDTRVSFRISDADPGGKSPRAIDIQITSKESNIRDNN